MRGLIEFFTFPLLAGACLLAAFLRFAPEAGSEAAGAGGDALVSVEASNEQIEALVEVWEAPTEPVELQVTEPVTTPAIGVVTPPVAATAPVPELLNAPVILPIEAVEPKPEEVTPEEPEVLTPVEEVEVRDAAEAEQRPQLRPAQRPRQQAEPRQQREQRQPRAQAQTEQRAAGNQGSNAAGNNGQAATATVSASEARNRRAAWGAQIRSRIERRKRRPRGRNSGVVSLQVRMHASGQLAGVSITSSSGHANLDEAALRAVRSVRRYPAAPDGITGTQSFNLSISFQ